MANLALHKKVLESSVSKSQLVTNGVVTGYTGHDGFAYFEYPGTLTVDLEKVFSLKCVRFLLWDGLGNGGDVPDNRRYAYRLGVSTDNADYRDFYDDDTGRSIGWQVFLFPQGVEARYVRIYGINNTKNQHIHVVELEAYDHEPAEPSGYIDNVFQIFGTSSLQAKDRQSATGVVQAKERKPIDAGKLTEIISTLETSPAINPALVDEIRERFQDLIVIDQNLGAIRQEIVHPVTREIRKANRLAVIALIITIIGLLLTIAFSNYGPQMWGIMTSWFTSGG